MKRCVFINLASAVNRRRSVEASFAGAARQGWSLDRFEAVDAAAGETLPGTLSPNEKGCFASHRAAISASLADQDHLFVAEDDIAFSAQAFGVLDGLLGQNGDWDVMFGDAALCDLNLMAHLASRRDAMRAGDQYTAIDLAGRSFCGSTGYLVRGTSKRRLSDALAAAKALDQPYDLYLRDLCHTGILRAAVCFPFVTTVSALADQSQIQGREVAVFDQTLNVFRRLMYAERDLPRCLDDALRLQAAHADSAAQAVGAIFATIVSPAFPLDR